MSPKSVLCAVCLALLGVSSARAGDEDRTVLLLLKDVPGAPTPEDIVNYTNTFPHAASPPLQAFTVKDPVGRTGAGIVRSGAPMETGDV